jgi:hypothetical protein
MRRKASAHDLTSVDVVAETRPTFSTISAEISRRSSRRLFPQADAKKWHLRCLARAQMARREGCPLLFATVIRLEPSS